MVKGVIFDMDGLMFDTERMWGRMWAPACKALGLQPPPRELVESSRGLAGQNLVNNVERFYPGYGRKMLDTVWELAGDEFRKGVPVKPGLIELLDWLEAHNIPRVVASSSLRSMIECNLRTTGTAKYFRHIVSGAEVKYSKPHPETFLLAAAAMELPPQDCLVLEDSYNGVRAGHAAGCVTVMVPDLLPPTDEMKTLYTACCTDLFQVRDMLERGAL
ncbi:MAG: HAD family hydrolase [Gemmiger sp.]